MKALKRLGSFLLALVMVLSMIPATHTHAAEVTSGYCGDPGTNGGKDVSWTFQDGVLTISGTGKTNEYGSMGEMYGVPYGHDHISTPWTETAVTSLVVEEGVTHILGLLSWGAYNLTDVSLPDSLKVIGHCSFEDCDSLTSITIPKNVTSIWSGAFWACENLTSITFTGDAPSINDYAFNDAVTATCYYPASANWPADKLKNYGGNLTWVAYDTCADGHSFGTDDVCTGCGILGGSCGSDLVWTLDDAGKLTITGTGSMEDYNFGSSPFYKYADKITSVSLPEGLTSIGERAFDATFPNLDHIEIPTSVTHIQDCAFGATYNKVKLKYAGTMAQWDSIYIDAISSYGLQYGAECSDGTIVYMGPCGGSTGLYDSVKYMLLGDGTLKITGSGAMTFYRYLNYESCFSSDAKIKKVEISEGVTSIAGYAFKNCTNLTEVHIPASVTSISYNVFQGCTALTDVYYGSNEKNWNKMSISSDSNEPLAAATIHYTDLCAGGHSWVDATCVAPKTCPVCDATEGEALGHSWVDANCTAPKTCTVCGEIEGEAIPTAHTWVEANCTYAKTCSTCNVTEGDAILDAHVFEGGVCKYCGLQGGTCGENAWWKLVDGVLTIYGSGEMTSAPWPKASITTAIIEEGITSICEGAFEDCEIMTAVSIPNTVTTLGSRCFDSCKSLASVDLPEGITTIPSLAFAYCWALTGIEIPESVTSIGYKAFAYCREMVGMQIPEKVTSIGGDAFTGCSKLKFVRFNGNAPTLGSYAFRSLTLKAFYPGYDTTWTADVRNSYGGSVTWVAYDQNHLQHSFDSNGICSCGCIGGTCGQNAQWALDPSTGTLYISGTGKMEDFYSSSQTPWANYKDAVRKVVVEEGITHVGGCAFKEFSNLETVSLPDSLASIGSEAIMLCPKLKEIEIPENVTQIGAYAFEQCYGLESVVLPEGLSTIGDGLFNTCTSLKSVTIPASVTAIGTSAFNGCNSLADVYYGSNEKAWNQVSVGSYNNPLLSATIHYTDPCLQGHTWKNADCVAPKTCTVCGETEGEALGHSWVDADCVTSKTCSVCGETEGEALGHDWVDADCVNPKTCTVCGETEGEALGHDWDDATCVAPKTCSVCGETEGAPLDHNWTPADCENPKTCTRCGATEGEVSGHTEVCGVCTACGIGLNPGDYQYTLDESAMTVTLTDYIGSGTDVHVAARYLLDGKEYRTLLEATSVFRGNTAITSVKIYDGVTVASNSMAEMFYGCASLKTADLTGLDTTGVTSLRRLFSECKKLTGVDVTGWDTSAVEDMSYLFDYCSALTTITGYENWNTGSLWNISKTFNRTTSIEKVDLSQWDLSKITNSGWCFQICYAEEILLPDNLAMMSAGFLNHPAEFAGSTFRIPSGVKKIGYAHTIYDFGTDAFTAFEVPAQNGYYEAVDGILYSEDGTELLAIPRGKTFENGVFEVPNTVTFMGELSFSRNYNIETLVLPDNFIIEYVPLYDARYIIEDGHGGNDTGNLNSGTNLSIAIYCYTGITAYDVQETNTRYEAVEGVIYSEDMTTLVAVPARYAQHLNIPEGVTTWNKEAMWADHAGNSNLLSLLSSCTGVSIPSTLCEIDAEQLSMINRLADRTSSAFTITVSEGNRTFHVNPTTGHLETHTYSQEVTGPTCEDAGYTTHTCDVCGDNYKTDPVPAKNHDWAAADCITPKTCKVCGETEGEALGHRWVDADCVNPKTCTVCGETEGVALGHSWQDATCSAPETCSRCGETRGVINPNGHAFGTDHVCGNCGLIGGYCGDPNVNDGKDVAWTLRDSTLTIFGAGDMVNFNFDSPWSEYSICEVVIEDGVTTIGDHAFVDCNDMTGITIPNGVTYIGSGAFVNCFVLAEIEIPNSVTTIGDSAFAYCIGLSRVHIPDSVTSLGACAFFNCNNVEELVLSNNLTTIEERTFSWFERLLQVKIPESVETICDSAFEGCTLLNNVVLSDGITTIGGGAFQSCISLSNVTYCGTEAQWDAIAINATQNEPLLNATRSYHDYPDAACEEEKICAICGETEIVEHQWVDADCVNPKTCSVCGETEGEALGHSWVDADCVNPKTCTVCGETEGVALGHSWVDATCVAPKSCQNCDATQGEKNPRAHKFTEENKCQYCDIAGGRCGSYAYWTRNDGVLTIYGYGEMWHYDVDSYTYAPWYIGTGWSVIESIVVEEGITTIGNDAFYNCWKTTSVSLPASLTKIGTSAFSKCAGLTDVFIADLDLWLDVNLASVSSSPWWESNQAALHIDGVETTDLVIPDGTDKILDNTFYNCAALQAIHIPQSVTSIGAGAFHNATNVTKLTLSEGVSVIGDAAFSGCSQLTEVWIPNSVTSIGRAFYNCSGLKEIVIPETVEHINASAFGGAALPEDIYYGGTAQKWATIGVMIPKTTRVHSECKDPSDHWIDQSAEPTCTSEGYTYQSCSCGFLRNKQITANPIDHTYDQTVIAIETLMLDATCTEAAVYYYSCKCGRISTSETDTFTNGSPLGHKWQDADCQNPKTCDRCGKTEGVVTGHSWVGPTCYAPKTCSVCGTIDSVAWGHNWLVADCDTPETCSICGETRGEALGHDWVDANCTAPKTCIRCNETEGEALGHNWLAATCIAPETCTGCGITRGEKFPHTPVVDAAVEATCTTTGLTEGQHCSACGEVLVAQQTVPTKNHTWKSATCTTPKTCTVCGKTEGEALGHNWVAADCDTAKTCSVCGATEGNPLGHTVVTDKAVEATCTATGLTEGQHCSVCGEVLVAQQTVPKKNHTWKSATCTAPQTCTVCGQTNGDAKGHDWKAATCTENAVCKRCGEVATGTKLPHAEAVVSAVAATCTTVGKTEGKYCTVCGTVTKAQQTIPALGHTEVIDPAVEATCTTIGKTEGSHCSVCGTVIAAQQTIHAKGHAAVPDAAVAATCTTPGKTSGSHCKTCGEVIMAQVVIPAAGHSWQDGNCYTPKTCKVCGVKEGGVVHAYEHRYDYKCDLCGVERIVDMTRPMVDMFRMYDPNSGEHFYTGSTVERDNLVAVGWQYEGVGFTFPLTTGDPVHRLYDPVYGEHLYTMDVEEMNELLAKGWNYEGIAFNSGFENEVPQYRLHNPNETRGAYHFTASIEERDHLISLGWEYQGIGWYSLGA